MYNFIKSPLEGARLQNEGNHDAAKIVFRKLLNDDPDNFYKAKISSGNYFMTKILPETGSLMSSILSGAKFYNDYDDNFFDLGFKL